MFRFCFPCTTVVILSACLGCGSGQAVEQGAVPPPPPHESTSSADDNVTRTFALHDISLTRNEVGAPPIGLNLDERITLDPGDIECSPPDTTVDPILDGEDGIDNAFGARILPTLPLAAPCLEDDIALHHGRGRGTLLLIVRHWNGEANDARVDVTITHATHGTSADPEDVMFGGVDETDLVLLSNTSPAPAPTWTGDDNWFVDRRDFNAREQSGFDIDNPKNPLQGAYVANDVLVVPLLDRLPIEVLAGTASLELKLTDAHIVAQLDDSRTAIANGVIAGRHAVSDLVSSLPNLHVCGLLADGQEAAFNQAADVMSIPGTGAPEAICNSLSMGIPFKAVAGEVVGFGPEDSLPAPIACGERNFCCPGVDEGLRPAECDLSPYEAAANPIPVPAPN